MSEFAFLKVEAKMDGDKIISRASGAWAGILGPYLDQFFEKLNTLKVIAKKDGANVFNLYNPPHPTEAGMRFLTRKLRMMLEKKAYPVTANLAITHRCHCKCIHCSADPFIDKSREEVTTEEVHCDRTLTVKTMSTRARLTAFGRNSGPVLRTQSPFGGDRLKTAGSGVRSIELRRDDLLG